MQNMHLSESAHGLTAKHPRLTPSRPSMARVDLKNEPVRLFPLPIRCFELFRIFIYLIFNLYIYQYIYFSAQPISLNSFLKIKYTLICEF